MSRNSLLEAGAKSEILVTATGHVTYAFQSESTPYSCLDVKELLTPYSLLKESSHEHAQYMCLCSILSSKTSLEMLRIFN